MQAPHFNTLREYDTFHWNGDGGGFSTWMVTGADGSDMIDAKCIDPGCEQQADEVFYLSGAHRMTILGPYTPEHATRQANIRNWQFYSRQHIQGQDVVSKHISPMCYRWAQVINSEGQHVIRFVGDSGMVHYCLRTQAPEPITLVNPHSGEHYQLRRDVCHEHPAWVHRVCGTKSESELQDYLSNL